MQPGGTWPAPAAQLAAAAIALPPPAVPAQAFFIENLLPALQQAQPNAGQAELERHAAALWEQASAAERSPFELLAEQDRLRSQTAVEEYHFRLAAEHLAERRRQLEASVVEGRLALWQRRLQSLQGGSQQQAAAVAVGGWQLLAHSQQPGSALPPQQHAAGQLPGVQPQPSLQALATRAAFAAAADAGGGEAAAAAAAGAAAVEGEQEAEADVLALPDATHTGGKCGGSDGSGGSGGDMHLDLLAVADAGGGDNVFGFAAPQAGSLASLLGLGTPATAVAPALLDAPPLALAGNGVLL